jgi:hypothetical protein
MTISFSLRLKVRCEVRYVFLAYCWVIVEPPWLMLPPLRSV